MNGLKMGVAVLLSGLMLGACGETFKPLENINASKGTLPNPGVSSPDKNIEQRQEISLGLSTQEANALFPANDQAAIARSSNLANSIKAIQLIMTGVESSAIRKISTQIATGCIVDGGITGLSIIKENVDMSYLKGTEPTRAIDVGNSQNYSLKFICHDSGCKDALLQVSHILQVNGGENVPELEESTTIALTRDDAKKIYIPVAAALIPNSVYFDKNVQDLVTFNAFCNSQAPATNGTTENEGVQEIVPGTEGIESEGIPANFDPFGGPGFFTPEGPSNLDPNIGPGI